MMPASDQAVLARRDAIVAALRAIVPGEGVIDSAAEMVPYESNGLMAYRQPPMVVVLPDTTEQVSQVLKYCFEQGIKVVPRGSGTSLSGGALPLADGVLLGLGKSKRIREIAQAQVQEAQQAQHCESDRKWPDLLGQNHTDTDVGVRRESLEAGRDAVLVPVQRMDEGDRPRRDGKHRVAERWSGG